MSRLLQLVSILRAFPKSVNFLAFVLALALSEQTYAQAGIGAGGGGTDYTKCGKEAAEDLANERKNIHRMAEATGTDDIVYYRMFKLFGDELLSFAQEKLDINLAPLLHDIRVFQPIRAQIAEERAESLLPWALAPEYYPMHTDRDFKICCVREKHENSPTAAIVAEYPGGDGWTGLWEYYFPTTITEWSNQSTETMIVPSGYVQEEVNTVKDLLKDDVAATSVARSIAHLKGVTEGTVRDQGKEEKKDEVKKLLEEIDEKVKDEHKFTEDISMTGGVTTRVFLPGMMDENRKLIAGYYCMHPDQFLKIMDLTGEDEYQRQSPKGGLEGIPPFSTMFFNGAYLLLDHKELDRLEPRQELKQLSQEITDIPAGYRAWKRNMLGRQSALANAEGQDWSFARDANGGLEKVLEMAGGRSVSQQQAGHTYYQKNNSWMIPLMMRYHTAQLDRMQFNALPIAWRVAAGLFDASKDEISTKKGKQSYYKNFEPQPYYKFEGLIPQTGDKNEFDTPCRRKMTHTKTDKQKPDRILLSRKTHNWVSGPQDTVPNFDMRSQTKGGGAGLPPELADRKDGDTPNKCSRDDFRHRYAANLTIFRTCPKKWRLWKGADTLLSQAAVKAACPGEKLW